MPTQFLQTQFRLALWLLLETRGIDGVSSDPMEFSIEKKRKVVASVLIYILPTVLMTSSVVAARSLGMVGSGHVAGWGEPVVPADRLTFPSSLQPHFRSHFRASETSDFPPITAIPGTCYNDMITPTAPGNTWMYSTWWSNRLADRAKVSATSETIALKASTNHSHWACRLLAGYSGMHFIGMDNHDRLHIYSV